ncbi:MAG: VOC family protein [Woeseia sp.]
MELGAFSVSLAVKDLGASKEFYEKLGFTVFHDQSAHNWMIMKNGDHIIGLFQGMFDKNILTFNPGWDQNGAETEAFTDIREIQRRLKQQGVQLGNEVDPATSGPASLMLTDPDDNTVLIDQHR